MVKAYTFRRKVGKCDRIVWHKGEIWDGSNWVIGNVAQWKSVLVLAEAELIFTSVGLGFGFVQKTVLIMQGCIQHWWAALTAKAFSAPHTAPPARRLGLHRGLNSTDQRDIPQLVASCPALKPGARLAAGPLVGCMVVSNGFNLHHSPFLGFSFLCFFFSSQWNPMSVLSPWVCSHCPCNSLPPSCWG